MDWIKSVNEALTSKAEGYVAWMRKPDGDIGITPAYPRDTLDLVIEENAALGHVLLHVFTETESRNMRTGVTRLSQSLTP